MRRWKVKKLYDDTFAHDGFVWATWQDEEWPKSTWFQTHAEAIQHANREAKACRDRFRALRPPLDQLCYIARTGTPHATTTIAGCRQQIIQTLQTPPTPRGLF
ncbi:hypothetical protein [Corynebacterium singulare]|uniref:hypothetical protein n=1 Tax=Corynebacterium singulare TaxID=161899 RepID=UPI00119CA48C|nr:hypothetical protein [Corynebacterium singulare]